MFGRLWFDMPRGDTTRTIIIYTRETDPVFARGARTVFQGVGDLDRKDKFSP